MRASAYHFHLFEREDKDIEVAKITNYRLALGVNKELFCVFSQQQLQLFGERPAKRLSANDALLGAKSEAVSHLACAKRFRRAEHIDGLKPVSLTLSIIAVKDVESGTELSRAFEIAKPCSLNSRQNHS